MPTDINTISAWTFLISTLVSALTGFFIVQTFLLQAKVAQEQTKITKLEVERAIMEKSPVFFGKRHIYHKDETVVNARKRFRVDLSLLRNDIYSYELKLEFPVENYQRYYEFKNFPVGSETGLIEGSVIVFDYTLPTDKPFLYTSQPGFENTLAFRVRVKYLDRLKNEHNQILMIFHDNEPLSYPAESEGLNERHKKLLS